MSKTFQPDSLHPYIMDARLKKATGSGGISNIPIASADTVGGIKIGGGANPITITGSGNASVRKATSELLGVVKAGDGVSIDADGAISVNIDISTSENKTGRIINDKPEYVKEISLTNTSLTAGTNIDILASGASQYDQVTGCRLVYTSDSEKGSMDCPVWIDVSGSKVSVKPTGTASSLTSLKAILKYLKP